MTELDDGSWILAGAWYPGGHAWGGTQGEQLEFFRSTDRGKSWKFYSVLQAYDRWQHSISEPSILTLPDGRLILFARENRQDGFPGIKAFSADNGKTWNVEELPFAIIGRTHAGFLKDGRVMLTFRAGIGLQALWAWIGDPLEKIRMRAAGVHFNDSWSVGTKDGALHIDSDGALGQFTQYFLRPPAAPGCRVDILAEVKVVANSGLAATLSVPFAGKLRLFRDHVVFVTRLGEVPASRVNVNPDVFHTYRVVTGDGQLKLFVDGELKMTTAQIDDDTRNTAWTPASASWYGLAFGNERQTNWGNHDPQDVHPDVWPVNITPEVTGYSVWRRVEATVDEPGIGSHVTRWTAERDGFPDQYQLDHMIEVEASTSSHDQGYSGWTHLPDGRIFVVSYTDDTAQLVKPSSGGINARMGISWLRGTYLEPEDLPPRASR